MVRTTEKPSKPKLKDQNNPATGQADGNGTSPFTREAEDSTARRPELSPEARAKLAEIRGRIETSVGQVVLIMMQVPRYRHHTLSDLNHLVIEPLLRDRVAIAYAAGDEERTEANQPVVGVAIWASVSDEIDAKITEQIKAGAFPVRLGAEEWTSGDTVWLVDIIAPNRRAASAVLANFRNVAGAREIKLHPLVGQSVDPELLKALRKP
jgi:hemolysin-activating ACP:hemolysin acyltransferase